MKKIILNYVGQLRIYSLIDLLLLLIVIKANWQELAGAILLHVGFLAYLESCHKDKGRKKVPNLAWIILGGLGILIFPHLLATGGYILTSFFYIKKKKGYWGIFAPIMRGLQNYFVVAGIVGFLNYFAFIVFIALFLRNLSGDYRDTIKDRMERMQTIPMVIGLKGNIQWMHLIFLFGTSTLWWTFSSLTVWVLVLVIIVQRLTYNLTPR